MNFPSSSMNQPKPHPPMNAMNVRLFRREERDREDDGDRHHRRAPDRVRDVQRAVAELRVAGD